MLTLRGEHFCFIENIEVISKTGPLPALGSALSPSPRPSNLLPDALAGRILRGKGILARGGQPPAPAIAYDGQLAVNHHD